MLATLAEQPIYTKIGRVTVGPGGGAWLLQLVDLLGRQCEVLWEDNMCLSEYCRSFQAAGATMTEVTSCWRRWPNSRYTQKSNVSRLESAVALGYYSGPAGEDDDSAELAKMMMSKKNYRLYQRMQHSNKKKTDASEALRQKRRKLRK